MKRNAIFSLLLLVFIVATSCNATYTVYLILHESGIEAGTYNQLAVNGAQLACTTENDCVLQVVSAVNISSQIDRAVTSNNVSHVITVDPLYTADIIQSALKYPNVLFSTVDTDFATTVPNAENILFEEDEIGFLAGVLAGEVSKLRNNKVAVLGGMPIVPVKEFLNGFVNGAMYSCPECLVYCQYAGSFDNRTEGVMWAQKYAQKQPDVLFAAGGMTGTSAMTSSAGNMYVIGVDSDEWETAFYSGNGSVQYSEKILSSAIKKVDVAVYDSILRGIRGNFTAGRHVYRLANNGISMAPCHEACDVYTPAIQSTLLNVELALANGSLTTGVDPNGSGDSMTSFQCTWLEGDGPQTNTSSSVTATSSSSATGSTSGASYTSTSSSPSTTTSGDATSTSGSTTTTTSTSGSGSGSDGSTMDDEIPNSEVGAVVVSVLVAFIFVVCVVKDMLKHKRESGQWIDLRLQEIR